MIICCDCGNKDKFTKVINYREWASETALIDGETEDEEDYFDHNVSDSERQNEEAITCQECESETTLDGLDEKGILDVEWKHTDKKGKWHKDELDEDKRNKELGEQYLLKCI